MQITATIEDALFEKALEMSEPGPDELEMFIRALETDVRVQAAKRLAALGGVMPDMQPVPRCSSTPTPW